MEEILGTLELDGKFVSQYGSIISFAANKTVTVKGMVVNEDGKWSTTEHTGNLKVENNKIVSDSIIVNDYAYKDGEAIERKSYCKLEITVNPKDVTTLLIKTTYKGIGDNDYEYYTTDLYIPVETTKPNFDRTWTLGDNKLILSNGKFAIVDDTQVLYSGNAWVQEVKNRICFQYDISETDYVFFDGYLARSGKFYIRIYSSKTNTDEYFVSTKLSDSVDVDFDIENTLIGKYKSFYVGELEITESSIIVDNEILRISREDDTYYRPKNLTIDYKFSFMDFCEGEINLGERNITYEILKWNNEKREYEVIGEEDFNTVLHLYNYNNDGYITFQIRFGDKKEYEWGWDYEYARGDVYVKYETAPVDFTGTWVLTEKLYNDERYETAEITINSDGSYSLLVDGKEMNTENDSFNLEYANSVNLLKSWINGIITENGELFCNFFYYDEEGNKNWDKGFFTKR